MRTTIGGIECVSRGGLGIAAIVLYDQATTRIDQPLERGGRREEGGLPLSFGGWILGLKGGFGSALCGSNSTAVHDGV